MPTVYEVAGASKLRRELKAAGASLDDLKDAHAEVAGLVRQAAHVPIRRGFLANSLRSSGTKTAAVVRAGGARVPYANAIHWGWKAHHIPANPFIYKAAQDTEGRWVPVYAKHVDAILQTITGDKP